MDTLAVDLILAEVDETVQSLADPMEGLRDRAALNLKEPTRAAIAAQIPLYERRLRLLREVGAVAQVLRDKIDAVLADGHPVPPVSEVSPEVLEDFAAQDRTQAAASKTFRRRSLAVAATVTFSDPEKK